MELYSLPNKHKGAGCYAVPSDVCSLLRGLGQPGLVAIEIACSIVFVAMGFEGDRTCRSLLDPFGSFIALLCWLLRIRVLPRLSWPRRNRSRKIGVKWEIGVEWE